MLERIAVSHFTLTFHWEKQLNDDIYMRSSIPTWIFYCLTTVKKWDSSSILADSPGQKLYSINCNSDLGCWHERMQNSMRYDVFKSLLYIQLNSLYARERQSVAKNFHVKPN